ncbi:MAG: hypothetical protein JWQ71_1273 [Pedosphaera sp.]|nr:hypothetical protein [Pedosphaera sp.]
MTEHQANHIILTLNRIVDLMEGKLEAKEKSRKPLTAIEVAKHYRVSAGSIINWARAGLIPHAKLGSVYRFPNPEALQLCLPPERGWGMTPKW